MTNKNNIDRRQFIKSSSALGLGMIGSSLVSTSIVGSSLVHASVALPETKEQIYKMIAKTGERLPVIGMGTSRTFDTYDDSETLKQLQQVTQTFFDMGGAMIDSSPMYGEAQKVIGQVLKHAKGQDNLFSATKVWTEGESEGLEQMERSRQKWGIKHFDLMQIHNLVDWQTHLDTLKQMKADGAIRYIGMTTSHGRSHQQLEKILKQHEFDFLQLSYNIGNRDVEKTLLPLALEKGVSIIVNRPYQRGSLFSQVKRKALPEWTKEFDCNSWGQFFLKFVVSHPAVTNVIPATTKVKHMQDNMLAGKGRLPTAKQRLQMLKYFEA